MNYKVNHTGGVNTDTLIKLIKFCNGNIVKEFEEEIMPIDEPKKIFISGPVNATYRSKDGKKIILLSDIHESNDKCTQDNKLINEYLEEIFKQDNGTIDFFIELDWHIVKNGNIDVLKHEIIVSDYISTLQKLALDYYKQNDKIRIHFSDVRTEAGSLLSLNKPVTELISQVSAKDENFNFMNIFKDMYGKYINILFEFYTMIREYDKGNPLKDIDLTDVILKKAIVKLEEIIGREKFTIILTIIRTSIEHLFEFIFNDNFMTLDAFNYLGFYIITPYTYIGELYTLARLMKPEFNKIIIYEGKAHIDFLNDFLDVLEFKRDHEFDQVSENCINVIPFEDYLDFEMPLTTTS